MAWLSKGHLLVSRDQTYIQFIKQKGTTK